MGSMRLCETRSEIVCCGTVTMVVAGGAIGIGLWYILAHVFAMR